MVSCGMSCIKYLLFAFNLVFVIFGILLIYSGFSTLTKIGHYEELIGEAPNNSAIALIIVGFVIFFIAFLGCFGAIRENSCMLTTFSAILLVLFIIELIGAVYVFAFMWKLETAAEEVFKNAIEKYDPKNTTDSSNEVLDDIQSHLECCGALTPLDWNKNKYFNGTNTYPHSCCPRRENNTTVCAADDKLYTKGCVVALENDIRGEFALLGGIAIAIAVVQWVGIIFACSLSRKISKTYERF